MEFIKGWTIAIAGIILLSTLIELLMPQVELKKYANLALGFLVMMVLLRPVADLKSGAVWQNDFWLEYGGGFSQTQTEIAQDVQSKQIKEVFAERLKQDIEQKLSRRFGRIQAEVKVSTDDNGGIVIDEIAITGGTSAARKEIRAAILSDYGCENVTFGG